MSPAPPTSNSNPRGPRSRKYAAASAAAPAARVAVRVHAVDHPAFDADVATVVGRAGHRWCHVMVPKVESLADVERAVAAIDAAAASPTVPALHVLVESPAAVHRAFDIAAHPRVQSISFGLMDFVSAHGGAIPASGMGVAGQFSHPLVLRAKMDIASACHAHGKVPAHGVVTEFKDVAALQAIYGSNTTYRATNTVYSWGAGAQIFETIWDAGGIDLIDASNQTQSAIINLRPGTLSSIGAAIWNGSFNMRDTLGIAYGAVIENATGTGYSDIIYGNSVANVLTGGAGNDTLDGGQGNDTISGGAGDDTISGNAGNDSITGGAGVDNINAGAGANTITDAGDGADVITHDQGSSTVTLAVTGSGVVTLNASQAGATANSASGVNTTVNASGSSAAVTLNGNSGADSLTGGSGDDTISGGAGNDSLVGNGGDDSISGGSGNDTINGGAGSNTITDAGDGAGAFNNQRVLAAQALDAAIATTLRPFSQPHQREEAFKLLQRQADSLPALVDRLLPVVQQQGRWAVHAHSAAGNSSAPVLVAAGGDGTATALAKVARSCRVCAHDTLPAPSARSVTQPLARASVSVQSASKVTVWVVQSVSSLSLSW